MPIHILPVEIASQIAAGEVVERPASVVKELIENSLDAQTGHISISIEGAGKKMIEVADDGSGIPHQELKLAVARHATSKLNSADDLFRITTLGFRGEALASIGSISHMIITSRILDDELGMRLNVEGGHVKSAQKVGAPLGTVVRVENLFFNVPARLKFLKTDRTERRHIDALVTRYALAYPGVRFQLRQEGRLSLQTSGNGDQREVLASFYGVENAKQMLEVLAEIDISPPRTDKNKEEILRITGYISPTTLTRANRREIHFFVNGRPVQDSTLSAALIRAYHTLLMVGRFPMAVLFLKMPPETVDVNVHPTKAEVRFRNQDGVFRAVGRAVRRALLAYTPVADLVEPPEWATNTHISTSTPVGSGSFSHSERDRKWSFGWDQAHQSSKDYASAPSSKIVPSTSQPVLPEVGVPLLRLIGQIAVSYLVAEGPDGLYLIDQHAAHERVLFERFMSSRASAQGKESKSVIPTQMLLEPVVIELPPASARLLEDQLFFLGEIGFAVEQFGRGSFIVRAVPSILSDIDPEAALRVLVDDFEEDETPLQTEYEAKIIARICKRAAVKAGQVLSFEEQGALLRDLEACQSPRTCPHGRPTMIHLSVNLLERQFGRK